MKKLISYVLPVYNDTGNVDILFKTILHLTKPLEQKYSFEFICVNDGSRDDSLEKLLELQKKEKRMHVLNFSRNFGHQIAVTAGLDFAEGDAVIIMDTDMEDPPRVSLELIDKWEEGYEVVYAQRRSRQDPYLRKLAIKWFYIFLQKIADINIPRNTGDYRLVDKKVADELRKFREHNRFMRGMVSFVGFKQTAVLYDRDQRHSGVSNYPLKKLIKLAADGIMGFSSAPLKLISRAGLLISLLSFAGIIYALYIKLFTDLAVPGWTITLISILFIGGVQLVMLGVLGSYIGRIYSEVQNRPLYIVDQVFSERNKENDE